jgi:TonB family protein
MKLLLAGKWPPLKPLPVFKYETDEYRASIDFDKTRGEWVCHKTSLPSNKVQELRGGLTEITMALPHGRAEVFAECAAAGHLQQELEKDASRRLQAMLEWKENYENGALYAGLQDYLSESQQDEIEDSIRLTLTARQLQFNPKNVACVFDALSKAGGKLATLMEIARRKKTNQVADVPAIAEAAAPGAEGDVPVEAVASEKPAPEFEGLTPAPVESLIPANFEAFPEEAKESVFPVQDQHCSPEPVAYPASEACRIVTPEILDAGPPSFVEDLREKVQHHAPIAGFEPQVRSAKVAPSKGRIENSSSRSYVLEISGFQVTAVAFLFAVVSVAVGFTVARGPLGRRLRDAQESILAVDAASPVLLSPPSETTSPTFAPPAENTLVAPVVYPPAQATTESRLASPSAPPLNVRPEDSTTRVEPIGPTSATTPRPVTEFDNPKVSPERKGSTGLIARDAWPPANSQPAHPSRAGGRISRGPRNPAPRRVTPAPRAASRLSAPSTVLVTGPGDGSKPFRLTLPEKPIAASSSFAMTSQLSVLIAPESGPPVTHKPSRLQAAELVSFVWPRYPGPGDRYGSAEMVKVRTTIGELGQVLDIKLVSGSASLLPAAISAIRLWRYKPALLNQRPIQAQQDVTIEFRPPQYMSHLSSQHPAHN